MRTFAPRGAPALVALTVSLLVLAGPACKNGDGENVQLAVCGNAVLESGEGCDDGNTTSGDGCSATCQWEQPVCEPAWELACGASDSWSTTGTGTTDQVDAYACTAYNMNGPEYAYSFVPTESGTVRATLSGAAA